MNKPTTNLDDLNLRTLRLIDANREQFEALEIAEHLLPSGAKVLDFAVNRSGTTDAGVLLAKICMADFASIELADSASESSVVGEATGLKHVNVQTEFPLVACMASQYAGWPFSHEKYFAMCSGPARSVRGIEKVLTEYDLTSKSEKVVGVFESNESPTDNELKEFASQCNTAPENVIVCVARTASLPGSLQVVARSVETAMHKLHELDFDLGLIRAGAGSAPMPPIPNDDLTALGWTNDAVLYGGEVVLTVDCDDDVLKKIGPQVPSCSSSDFGTPFLETFEKYDRDFYKIDKLLFSPARIIFQNVASGNEFSFGELCPDVLRHSYGSDADGSGS